jgi:hypothetical protein
LFLELADHEKELPWPADKRADVSKKLAEFATLVDGALKFEDDLFQEADEDVLKYTKNVARAASDKGNRIARGEALSSFLFKPPVGLL